MATIAAVGKSAAPENRCHERNGVARGKVDVEHTVTRRGVLERIARNVA